MYYDVFLPSLPLLLLLLFFSLLIAGKAGRHTRILGPSVKVPAQQIAYVDADHGKG